MNKAFEKIISQIGELANYNGNAYLDSADVIEIVQEVAEEYKGGWIPCGERLPEECIPVNVTWINRKPEPYYAKIKDVPFSATAVYCKGKWYWYSSTCVDYLSEYEENNFDLIDKDIDIVSWQPLPEPFKESD